MFNCRNGATLKLGGAKTELPWRDTEISKSAGPLRSNLSITWATEVLLRWFKLLWKAKTQGYKFDVGHFGKFPKDAWWQSQPRPGRGGHHGRGWPSVHEISKAEPTTARPWWSPRPWLAACYISKCEKKPWRQPISFPSCLKTIRVERGEWVVYKRQVIRVEGGAWSWRNFTRAATRFLQSFSSPLFLLFYFIFWMLFFILMDCILINMFE